MPRAEPRAGIRATTRKSTGHNPASHPRPIQAPQPITRPPQPPPRSLRRPSTLPQGSGSGPRGTPPAPSWENHETCLATVETLERENEALRREKESLSERLRGVESEKQKLLAEQLQWRQQVSERQATQHLVQEIQHTVAGWHQRCQSSGGLPAHADPTAMTTALAGTTAVPQLWPTQEGCGEAFENTHDIVPGSDHFTQFFDL